MLTRWLGGMISLLQAYIITVEPKKEAEVEQRSGERKVQTGAARWAALRKWGSIKFVIINMPPEVTTEDDTRYFPPLSCPLHVPLLAYLLASFHFIFQPCPSRILTLCNCAFNMQGFNKWGEHWTVLKSVRFSLPLHLHNKETFQSKSHFGRGGLQFI